MSTEFNICEECDHPMSEHGPEGCDHDRQIHADGIEIDGPCGCKGPIEATKEAKRQVERALFQHSGLRNFLTDRRA
jgi:hypothetical protein